MSHHAWPPKWSPKNEREQVWWCTAVTSAFRRQKDLKFKASLGYIVSSRLAWLYRQALPQKRQKKKKKKKGRGRKDGGK
jgi:hypothetical protein